MKTSLAERLKLVRKNLGYTQQQIASAAGAKPRSWQDYECGKSIPGGRVLAGLAGLGTDINWLLTGETPAPRIQSDVSLMSAVIHAFERVLIDLGPTLSPTQREAVVTAFSRFYDHISGAPESRDVSALLAEHTRRADEKR